MLRQFYHVLLNFYLGVHFKDTHTNQTTNKSLFSKQVNSY